MVSDMEEDRIQLVDQVFRGGRIPWFLDVSRWGFQYIEHMSDALLTRSDRFQMVVSRISVELSDPILM